MPQAPLFHKGIASYRIRAAMHTDAAGFNQAVLNKRLTLRARARSFAVEVSWQASAAPHICQSRLQTVAYPFVFAVILPPLYEGAD